MSSINKQSGYYLNKTGERVDTLLERQYIVPTLSTTPSDSTLTWEDGEYTVVFKIGDFCRVKTQEEYKFYRLHDINNSRAVWIEENYYNKEEVNTAISTAIQSIPKGVNILSIEEFESLKESENLKTNEIYLIIEKDEPYELYIGSILIAKKSDIALGFPYNFPFNF